MDIKFHSLYWRSRSRVMSEQLFNVHGNHVQWREDREWKLRIWKYSTHVQIDTFEGEVIVKKRKKEEIWYDSIQRWGWERGRRVVMMWCFPSPSLSGERWLSMVLFQVQLISCWSYVVDRDAPISSSLSETIYIIYIFSCEKEQDIVSE